MPTLNPYVLLGGVISVFLVFAAFMVQSHQIHKYHSMYDCVNAADCPKNYKGDTLPSLRATINDMTTAQSNQTATTEKVITKIVQAPAQVVTKTVVKEIHDAPVAHNCKTPNFPQDVKDAY